jgi:ribulose-phosphate 3-epimerase
MIREDWKIIPAVIAPSQRELDRLLSLLDGKIGNVMLDFMDGVFVPQKSIAFNPRLSSSFNYEAHLMVNNPLPYLELLSNRISRVSIHVESTHKIDEAISKAREHDFIINLALNPDTSLDSLTPHLHKVDGVLVMTVEPGRYGSKFLPHTLKKVKKLREISKELHIEVDGGMNPVNARAAKETGANAFASGSYIFNSGSIEEAIKELEKAIS